MKFSSLRSASAPLVFTAATTTLLVFSTAGCGSGGGSAPVPGLPLASSVLPGYAGRTYTSQVAFAEGRAGNLRLTTAEGNTVTGVLEIVDTSRQATAKTRLVIATPFLSGTFDPASGAIHLTGSYIGPSGQTIPISIVGTLPTPPSVSGGSVTVTINGQSFTSPFGNTISPTPSPSPSPSGTPSPNPSASPTPSPSPSGTPAPVTGQNFSGQISNATSDYSGASTPVYAPELASSVFVSGSALVTPTYTQKRTGGTGETTVQFTLATPGATKDAPVAPGKYVIGAISGTYATAFYNEGAANGWKAASGEIIVDSVSGDIMSFRFVNLRMAPSRSFGSTASQGSFNISGSGNARVSCLTADTCK